MANEVVHMKVWKGQTPYCSPNRSYQLCSDEGYRAAMNSPEVRALYNSLKAQRLVELMGTPGAQEALAAYDAGLVETDVALDRGEGER